MMQLFERINFDVWGLQPSNQLSILRIGSATREDIREVASAVGLPPPDDLERNPTPYIKKLMDTVKKKAKRAAKKSAAKKSAKKRDGPEGEYCAICGGKLFKGGRKGDKWDDITNAGQSYTKDVDHIANLIYNTLLFLNNTGLGFLNTHRHCNQAFKSAKVWSPSYDLWLYLLQKATRQQSINPTVDEFEDAYPWPGRLAPGVLNRPMPPGGWRTFCVVNFQSQQLMRRFYKRNQGSNPGLQLMKNGMFVSAKNKKSNATGATLFNEGMGYYQYSAGMLEKLKKVLPIKERQMNACEVEAVTLDRWIGVTENNPEPQGEKKDTRNDTSLEDRQRRMALIERVCNAEDRWLASRVGERGSKILEQEYTVLTRVFPVMELISEVFHEESNLLRNRNLSKFLMSLVLNEQMDTEEKRRLESILGVLANDKFNTNLAKLQEQYSERESGTGIGLGEGESWMSTDGGPTTTVSRQVFYDGVERLITELGGINNLWDRRPRNLSGESVIEIIDFFFRSLNGRQTKGLIGLLSLAQQAIAFEISELNKKRTKAVQEATSKYDVLEAELLRCKEVMGDLGDEYIQKLQRLAARNLLDSISGQGHPMDEGERLDIWNQVQVFNEDLSRAQNKKEQKDIEQRRLQYGLDLVKRENNLPISNVNNRKNEKKPMDKVSWRYKNNNKKETQARGMGEFISQLEAGAPVFRNELFYDMKNKFEECQELERRFSKVSSELAQLKDNGYIPDITGLQEQVKKNEFMLWILYKIRRKRQQSAKQAQEQREEDLRREMELGRERQYDGSLDPARYDSPSSLLRTDEDGGNFSQPSPKVQQNPSAQHSAAVAVGKKGSRSSSERRKRKGKGRVDINLFGCSLPSLTYNPTENDEIPINFTINEGEEIPTPYERTVLALRVALANGDFDREIIAGRTGASPEFNGTTEPIRLRESGRIRDKYGITGVQSDGAWGDEADRQPRMLWHFLRENESPFLTQFFSSDRINRVSNGRREVIHWWGPELVLSALRTLCHVENWSIRVDEDRVIIENRAETIRLILSNRHWYVYTRRLDRWSEQWNSNGGDCGPGAVLAALTAVKQPAENRQRRQFVGSVDELVEKVRSERERVARPDLFDSGSGTGFYFRGGVKRTRKKRRNKKKTRRKRKYFKKTKKRKRRRKKRTRRK